MTNMDETLFTQVLNNGGTAIFNFNGVLNITASNLITDDVVLDGTGHDVKLDGGSLVRLLAVNPGARLTLRQLTLSGGIGLMGAAILNNGGSVVAVDCIFTNNIAFSTNSGNPTFGGAICNLTNGVLRLMNCSFLNNSALGSVGSAGSTNGGSGGPGGSAFGGAIYNAGADLFITNCTFHGNLARGGTGGTGGRGRDGYMYWHDLPWPQDGYWVTVYGGVGGWGGNGGNGLGGNVYSFDGAAEIVNVTIAAGNAVGGGGGNVGSPGSYYNGGGYSYPGTPGTAYGANLAVNSGLFRLQNSIIANPTFGSNTSGTVIDGGFNLCSDSSCGFNLNSSRNSTNPRLAAAPANNGGAAPTIAIQFASPAMNAGNDTTAPAIDQRGLPRYGQSDVGAFEFQGSPASDFYYATNDGSIVITGYKGSGGDVAIPDNINGWPVFVIGYNAFSYASTATNVIIPLGVRNIASYAFEQCPNLAVVTIPDTVTNIGIGAFRGIPALKSVFLPAGVLGMGDGVFAECSGLTNIVVDFVNSVYESYGGVLFNKGLASLIQFPGGKIGSYVVPNSVTNIANLAFIYCSGLTNVTLGTNLTSIGRGAFNSCSGLNGVTIPNSVKSMGDNVFAQCSGLKSVVIGDGVTSIPTSAFSNCGAMTNLVIGNGVASIANGAFSDCSSLTSITIPNNVTSIGAYAFLRCSNLRNVTLVSGLANILDGAFQQCYSLGNITIPASVTSVGDWALAHCTSLTRVFFSGNAPVVGGGSVFYNSAGAVVYRLQTTSGWPPVPQIWAGRPTTLWSLTPQVSPGSSGVVSNHFGFTIYWPGMLGSVVVEACTNLGSPAWLPISTNVLSNGISFYSDSQWTNYHGRFYRLRSQ